MPRFIRAVSGGALRHVAAHTSDTDLLLQVRLITVGGTL